MKVLKTDYHWNSQITVDAMKISENAMSVEMNLAVLEIELT
jgi:hypothetical protein